jgi:hypothetical protein
MLHTGFATNINILKKRLATITITPITITITITITTKKMLILFGHWPA